MYIQTYVYIVIHQSLAAALAWFPPYGRNPPCCDVPKSSCCALVVPPIYTYICTCICMLRYTKV